MHVALIIDPQEARWQSLAALIAHPEVTILQADDAQGAREAIDRQPALCLIHGSIADATLCGLFNATAAVVLVDERYADDAGREIAAREVAANGAHTFLSLPPDPLQVRRGAEQVLRIRYPEGDAAAFHASLSELHRLYGILETASYYDILSIPPDAKAHVAREAFHARAALWHPDGFASVEDAALRERAYEVYKRLAEAYRVLTDPGTRKSYDAGLQRGENRYVQEQKKLAKREEDEVNEKARRFYRSGMVALRSGDKLAARNSFKLALSMDVGNELILKRLAEVAEE